jgi:chitin disaccharide deacetylase
MTSNADPSHPQIVLHVDDVGMCHGANVAFAELSRLGVVDAGSLMVPCPWASEAAELAAAAARLDLGVHITLTSEKRHYRWGPVGSASRASGLVDGDGYLWRTVADLVRHADPEAVEAEMTAQVERALALGVDVTHLDDHMGAPFASPFFAAYLRVARRFSVPALAPRDMASYDPSHNLPGHPETPWAGEADSLAVEGHIVADRVLETPWTFDGDPSERTERLIARIGPGLSYFALHPNAPGEIEAIEPETAPIRIGEWRLFSSPTFHERLDRLLVRRQSLRARRDEMRRGTP